MDLFRRKDDRPRRWPWELLVLVLALLMSLTCVFLSTWLALRIRPEVLVSASMLSDSQADYRRLPSEETPFAPLDPAVGAEAATDVARLDRTPPASATPVGIVFLPSTPTVTTTPTPSPTASPVATRTRAPSATATALPTPTSPPAPTNTRPAPPSPTSTVTPAPTDTPVPTDTRVPTATPAPTNTPRPTVTSTATDTPVPTSTLAPTDTPVPTPTSTEVRPIVYSVVPSTMVNTDTLTVTVSGLNFQAGCSVFLDSVPLVASSCTPTTTVEASVPTGMVAGYYDLTVTNPDSLSGTLLNAYTSTNPIPLVTDITPAVSVITTTDLVVTISGDYFRDTGTPGNLRAYLGGTPLATVTYVSPVTLTAVVGFGSPSVALGAHTLKVTNPGPTDPTGSLVNAFTVYTYTTTCDPVPTCDNAVGEPDGEWVGLTLTGTHVITIDFGANGITDGVGYDMIFYEWPNPSIEVGMPGVRVDYTTIELSMDGSDWYTVFDWAGDDPSDVAGTSSDAYAHDGGPYPGEVENDPIPWYDLYPSPESVSHNNGIAIDIGVAAQAVLPPQAPLPPGPFRFVRVSFPATGTDAAQIDSIVRLH